MKLLFLSIFLLLSFLDYSLKAQSTIPSDSLNSGSEKKSGYLYVSTLTLSLSPKDKSIASFTINSNVGWSISTSEKWLSCSPSGGANVAKIVVTASSNPTNAVREATITISGSGVDAQILTASQAAGPIGIDEIELTEMKISPNPTQDFLFLNGFSKDANILIYDVNGRLLMQKANDEESFDVQALAFGVYYLKIVEADKVFTRKIVKQ